MATSYNTGNKGYEMTHPGYKNIVINPNMFTWFIRTTVTAKTKMYIPCKEDY